MISIIAAIDEKRGLGKGNDLLFKIPSDMKRLKEFTTGHPLVMGRKTFESLGRRLPNRSHIVISRDPASMKDLAFQPDVVVASLEEGLEIAKTFPGAEEIFIFGGGQVFTEAVEKDLVDRLYLTVVKGDYGADTFFPNYSMFTKVLKQEDHEEGEYHYTFSVLER